MSPTPLQCGDTVPSSYGGTAHNGRVTDGKGGWEEGRDCGEEDRKGLPVQLGNGDSGSSNRGRKWEVQGRVPGLGHPDTAFFHLKHRISIKTPEFLTISFYAFNKKYVCCVCRCHLSFFQRQIHYRTGSVSLTLNFGHAVVENGRTARQRVLGRHDVTLLSCESVYF